MTWRTGNGLLQCFKALEEELLLQIEDGPCLGVRLGGPLLDQGWCEPWFANPMKPDWLVCRLTTTGRALAAESA